jgi:hypothetical protein
LEHLPEFYESDTTPNRLNEQLANQWCAYMDPTKPICAPGSVNYTIGHCRIDSFTEVHSIRATLGYCQKCVASYADADQDNVGAPFTEPAPRDGEVFMTRGGPMTYRED